MLKPVHLHEVGSTNDWARQNPERLADGQWVVADRQTGGRGRLGRRWEGPSGNFMGSCRILPDTAERPGYLLSFVAALALHDAVSGLVERARLQLKWPNDLLLDGAKLSGILLEMDNSSGAIILGIGVNLRHAPSMPGRTTIALSQVVDEVPTPLAFAGMLGVVLDNRRQQWRTQGFAAIRGHWEALAHPVGTQLQVRVDGQDHAGDYLGLADDGALLLQTDGIEWRVHAGDVFALGEAGEDSHAAGS